MPGATKVSEAYLDTDKMALIANSAGPLLLALGQEAACAHAHYSIFVVMLPGPLLKECPHKIAQIFFVCFPKILQLLDVIKVVTHPLPDSPAMPLSTTQDQASIYICDFKYTRHPS